VVPGASESALGLLDEAQCERLADTGTDGVTIDAELFEVFVCDRELAVVVAAVLGKLDLDAIENPPPAQAQRPHGRRAQHLDHTRRKSPADLVARRHATRALAKAIARERTHERTSGVGGIG